MIAHDSFILLHHIPYALRAEPVIGLVHFGRLGKTVFKSQPFTAIVLLTDTDESALLADTQRNLPFLRLFILPYAFDGVVDNIAKEAVQIDGFNESQP